MTLPCPAAASIVPDVDCAPTTADLEWIAAVNLDSFLPGGLPFPDFLAEQARQHQLRGAESPEYNYSAFHTWLSGRIDELAKQAHFLGAADPATFDDRDEAMLARPSGRRGQRRPWIGASVGAIGGIADWLQQSYPETAATLRRHLCILERAARGDR